MNNLKRLSVLFGLAAATMATSAQANQWSFGLPDKYKEAQQAEVTFANTNKVHYTAQLDAIPEWVGDELHNDSMLYQNQLFTFYCKKSTFGKDETYDGSTVSTNAVVQWYYGFNDPYAQFLGNSPSCNAIDIPQAYEDAPFAPYTGANTSQIKWQAQRDAIPQWRGDDLYAQGKLFQWGGMTFFCKENEFGPDQTYDGSTLKTNAVVQWYYPFAAPYSQYLANSPQCENTTY